MNSLSSGAMDILAQSSPSVEGEEPEVYKAAVDLCSTVLDAEGGLPAIQIVLYLIHRKVVTGKFEKELADHLIIQLIKM